MLIFWLHTPSSSWYQLLSLILPHTMSIPWSAPATNTNTLQFTRDQDPCQPFILLANMCEQHYKKAFRLYSGYTVKKKSSAAQASAHMWHRFDQELFKIRTQDTGRIFSGWHPLILWILYLNPWLRWWPPVTTSDQAGPWDTHCSGLTHNKHSSYSASVSSNQAPCQLQTLSPHAKMISCSSYKENPFTPLHSTPCSNNISLLKTVNIIIIIIIMIIHVSPNISDNDQ